MKRWYVVNTQPSAEDRALWHLRNQGYECFLPRLRRLRSHARATRTVLEPLFPRYLFAFFDAATMRWRAVNGTRGVVALLTDGSSPLPVPKGLVEGLIDNADPQGVAGSAVLARLWRGRKVRIGEGAFAGQIGEIDFCPPGSVRVSVLLTLLGRVTTLQMPAYAIEPL
jgi:transcriptional antiterminator RfaH